MMLVKCDVACILDDNVPETRNEGQVKVEDILQPLDGGSRLVGEDLDEVWSCLVTGRLEGVIVELLDGVGELEVDLGAGQGTVDTGGSLGGVSSHEVVLVEEDDIATSQVNGVSGGQTGNCGVTVSGLSRIAQS